MANDLTLQHLYALVPAGKVNAYFDDSHNGSITEETPAVEQVLTTAEGIYYSRTMRMHGGDPNAVGSPPRALFNNDPVLRSMVAWLALEIASERKTEFCDAEGWGAYKAQYQRAITYIDDLSKGILRSAGEAVAGQGANTGGSFSPQEVMETGQEFIFAPSRSAPFGRGGF